MPLKSLEIENYRAIERAKVGFDATTVLFGENDSGLTSMFEALRLVLGPGPTVLADRVAPFHFRRTDGGATRPLHIRVEVVEHEPSAWVLPDWMKSVFPAGTRARTLLFDFRAAVDRGTGAISVSHRVAARNPGTAYVAGDDESAAWLRRSFPVASLERGWLTAATSSRETEPSSPTAISGPIAMDEDVAALERHRHLLLSGTTVDVRAEIEAGATAARALLDKFPGVFAHAAPVMSAMASEILQHATPERADHAERRSDGVGAGKIAAVLLLGALVDLSRQTLRDGALPEHARPILLMENPEAGLHPTTLASLWRLLERLTWQQVIETNSDVVLGNVPITALRRISRSGGTVTTWAVRQSALSRDALRKVSYHLRSRRAAAMFARSWILVEGETEFWMIGELARVMGYDLTAQGVSAVEFAQSGLGPLLRLADELGIACQVMVDGDDAGQYYAAVVASFRRIRLPNPVAVTVLDQPDIEHCFWHHGFADVIASVARYKGELTAVSESHVIHAAIDRTSKPFLALALIDAAASRGRQSVPPALRSIIETAVNEARVVD